MQAFFTTANVSGFKDITGASKSVNPGGQYFDQYTKMPGYWLRSAYANGSNSGVAFGTDPTPAARTDYKLGAEIKSGLSIVNPSNFLRKENADNDTVTYSATYSVTNTSADEINIYEIGVKCNTTTGSNSTEFFLLMDRTVLEEPINIKPGETKVITYELTFRWSLILE